MDHVMNLAYIKAIKEILMNVQENEKKENKIRFESIESLSKMIDKNCDFSEYLGMIENVFEKFDNSDAEAYWWLKDTQSELDQLIKNISKKVLTSYY